MKGGSYDVLYAGEDLVGWARCKREGTRWRIDSWTSVRLPTAPDSVGAYLAELTNAFSHLDLPPRAGRRGVGVLCPAMPLFSKVIHLPPVAEGRRRAALGHEVAEALPYPDERAFYATADLGGDELEERFALVAVPREWPEQLCATLAQMGFSVANLVPLPGGLIRLARQRAEAAMGALCVDAGLRQTHLVGASKLRTIPLGTLAHESAFGAYVPRLAREIRRFIKGFTEADGELPAEVCLSGIALREVSDLAELLEQCLGLPVKVLTTEEVPDVGGKDLFAQAHLQLLNSIQPDHLVEKLSLSLLPREIQERAAFRKSLPAVSLTVVMLLLSAAVFYGRSTLDQVHYERHLEALESASLPIAARLNEMQELLVEADMLAFSLGSIDVLSQRKDRWLRFLSSLQSTLVEVEDVWIDGLVLRPPDPAISSPSSAGGEAFLEGPFELVLSGCMIDRENPLQRVSARTRARVADLADRLEGGSLGMTVNNRRFDTSEPGILRFELSLILSGGPTL